eukprot:1524768-Pleurochrysis_carterae.AAC.1
MSETRRQWCMCCSAERFSTKRRWHSTVPSLLNCISPPSPRLPPPLPPLKPSRPLSGTLKSVASGTRSPSSDARFDDVCCVKRARSPFLWNHCG